MAIVVGGFGTVAGAGVVGALVMVVTVGAVVGESVVVIGGAVVAVVDGGVEIASPIAAGAC
jgi:hypothetical protein